MTDERKTELAGGGAVTPDHRELKDNGQQKGYVVLSPEERAKGFVRPVRLAYRHAGVRPQHTTRPLTEAEQQRYGRFGYVCFEAYPDSQSTSAGRFWTDAMLRSGCGTVTRMSIDIAETYARDPKFYGGTFCCGCGTHLPVEQFVWDGSDERVGS